MPEHLGVATDNPSRFNDPARAEAELRPGAQEPSKSCFGFEADSDELRLHALAALLAKSRREIRRRVDVVCVPRETLPTELVVDDPAPEYPIVGLETSHRSLVTGTAESLGAVSRAFADNAGRYAKRWTSDQLADVLDACLRADRVRPPFVAAARALLAG